MNCKICDAHCEKIFEKIILQKYPSSYYQCTNCNFIQTDEPIWLKEAYTNAITSLDIGLATRNITLRDEIKKLFPDKELFFVSILDDESITALKKRLSK